MANWIIPNFRSRDIPRIMAFDAILNKIFKCKELRVKFKKILQIELGFQFILYKLIIVMILNQVLKSYKNLNIL